MFGGYNGHSELSDLYSYRPGTHTACNLNFCEHIIHAPHLLETNSWTFELPRQGIPPPTKQGHTLTGTGTHLYMVGGSNSENEDRLDTFVYSLELQMWAVVPYELPPNVCALLPFGWEKYAHNPLLHSQILHYRKRYQKNITVCFILQLQIHMQAPSSSCCLADPTHKTHQY